jgi:hypothetical protein
LPGKVALQDTLQRSALQRLFVFALACCALAQQKSMPPATTERPVADRIATFERADRVARLMPDEVTKALKLREDVVADIGAGSGVMTRLFAN